MKVSSFSIGRMFIVMALLQALAIGIAGLGIAVYMEPPRPGPPGFNEGAEWIPPHRRANIIRKRIPLTTLAAALAILIISNLLIARWILPPVKRLRQATKQFGRGDWTDRINSNRADEFGELATAFNEMADRIENQMKAERAIIATVSHELRTPLTRLRIALELLEDEHPNSVKKLQTMTDDIVEIEQLIDNVFTSARLSNNSNEGGMLVSEMRTVTVDNIVTRAVERVNSRYPNRTIRVLEICKGDITISPILFRRALENLLENAHKYSDRDTLIDIEARQDIDHILFLVTSVGEPIPEGQRMKVFDPFFQMRQTQGTGLGLTLVKRIVEAHSGTAWVACESRKNTFAIRLPVAQT